MYRLTIRNNIQFSSYVFSSHSNNYSNICESYFTLLFFLGRFGGLLGGTGFSDPLGVEHAPLLSEVQSFTRLKSVTNRALYYLRYFTLLNLNSYAILMDLNIPWPTTHYVCFCYLVSNHIF